jgi:hypothetical protein
VKWRPFHAAEPREALCLGFKVIEFAAQINIRGDLSLPPR